jgi:hypothetical protein
MEVNAAEFRQAIADGLAKPCAKDKRKAYIREDLRFYRDKQTNGLRFHIKNPADFDPAGVPSSWRLIERIAVYYTKYSQEVE